MRVIFNRALEPNTSGVIVKAHDESDAIALTVQTTPNWHCGTDLSRADVLRLFAALGMWLGRDVGTLLTSAEVSDVLSAVRAQREAQDVRPGKNGCPNGDDLCGVYRAGCKQLCADCEAEARLRYPQGWTGYPGDTCRHGVYVGGCGADYMCGACEAGDDDSDDDGEPHNTPSDGNPDWGIVRPMLDRGASAR